LKTFILIATVAMITILNAEPLPAEAWRAGVARVNVTPQEPLWLSGYADRDHPAEGTLHELWAKALALQAADGSQVVLVAMDLIGIDRRTSRSVCRRIETKYGLPRDAVAICASHTHTGPVVGENLGPAYDIDPAGRKRIENYAQQLEKKLLSVVGEALDALQPAELSWGVGTADFAVNRRNNPEPDVPRLIAKKQLVGPVDHDVPVLALHDAQGRLFAIVSGYACHATVLNDYRYSGDWPGEAQLQLERRHPGAMAFFWAGCGGDQNPLPRRQLKYIEEYGRRYADAVDECLESPLKPLEPQIEKRYVEIELPFGEMPTKGELIDARTRGGADARWADKLLAAWERRGELKPHYPYPIQTWRLGSDVTWLFLGGEVVVDYSLRLKHELDEETTWIAAYANDVMGYIPSRRVLSEGGYEGAASSIGYGLPALWSPEVEKRLIEAVHKEVRQIEATPAEPPQVSLPRP
jgi:hypothetical protein